MIFEELFEIAPSAWSMWRQEWWAWSSISAEEEFKMMPDITPDRIVVEWIFGNRYQGEMDLPKNWDFSWMNTGCSKKETVIL